MLLRLSGGNEVHVTSEPPLTIHSDRVAILKHPQYDKFSARVDVSLCHSAFWPLGVELLLSLVLGRPGDTQTLLLPRKLL